MAFECLHSSWEINVLFPMPCSKVACRSMFRTFQILWTIVISEICVFVPFRVALFLLRLYYYKRELVTFHFRVQRGRVSILFLCLSFLESDIPSPSKERLPFSNYKFTSLLRRERRNIGHIDAKYVLMGCKNCARIKLVNGTWELLLSSAVLA